MNNVKSIQSVNHHQFNQYEELQDAIARECQVNCTIKVKPHCISIRTRDLADFMLAKCVVRQRTGLTAVRDIEPLKD